MGSPMFLWKMYSLSLKRTVSVYSTLPTRHLYISLPKLATEEAKSEPNQVSNELTAKDILQDLQKPELSEDEIMAKRFKARIPERIYRRHMLKEPVPFDAEYDFQNYRLRGYYARFGEKSKLNPGICWPTREEILETIHYDKIYEPPLQDRIQNIEAKRLEEEQRKKAVEDEVDKNMANLDKWMDDYHNKNKKKDDKTLELKLQREKLVEEISEYLGYDIDPRDPRFKEAVEQREKEKKKAMKVKKQQEGYDKMLEKLKKIAQSAK